MGPKEVAELALQPHKGTSETRRRRTPSETTRRLQPHKGTSETPREVSNSDAGPRFNPTRVRLKPLFFFEDGLS